MDQRIISPLFHLLINRVLVGSQIGSFPTGGDEHKKCLKPPGRVYWGYNPFTNHY